MSLIIGTAVAGGGSAPYQISRSLRFNSADTAYLNRTFTTPTSAKKFTISAWIKVTSPLGSALDFGLLCSANTSEIIGIAGTGAFGAALNGRLLIRFGDTNLVYYPQIFRDVSAWGHIVVAIDTDQAVQADRAKFYYNGVLQTATSSAITSGYSPALNTAATRYIGSLNTNAGYYANGYLTEYNFIDGQNLPSGATTWAEAFGQFNSNTGVWEPKSYAGTYGNNGFELSFADNSGATSTTLGKDTSGNGNNWTPNNFVVSPATSAGNDSLVDTPTNYGTDTGVGGSVQGNYCTANPLKKPSTSTITNGNLDVAHTSAGGEQPATFAFSSGKWYWEVSPNSGFAAYGIILTSVTPSASSINNGYHYYGGNGQFYTGTSGVAYGATFTNGDVIGVALNLDTNQITFYKNGVSQGAQSISAGEYFPDIGAASTTTTNCNFGQRAFAYTAPSGFKALCTQNFTTPTIGATSTTQANKYMDVTLYTGNQTVRSITNSGSMQPDFVWDKLRSGGNSHRLFDALRGVEKALYSNLTNIEATETGTLTAFNSNGFSLGTNTETNTTGSTYVAWQWNAGGSSVTNTAGSITSTVRSNTTSGFSIVTYTGTGSAATIGHGCQVGGVATAPSMIIIKNRQAANSWAVYHISTGANQQLLLNSTNGISSDTQGFTAVPSNTVFSVGTGASMDTNQTSGGGQHVAYCFAPVGGYSAFGSYTANNAVDGVFVYLGFRPRWLMIKRSSSSGNSWGIWDTSRSPYNSADNTLWANQSYAENSVITPTPLPVDILSNGFKLRSDASEINGTGTYIYAAFAESPFKYSLAR